MAEENSCSSDILCPTTLRPETCCSFFTVVLRYVSVQRGFCTFNVKRDQIRSYSISRFIRDWRKQCCNKLQFFSPVTLSKYGVSAYSHILLSFSLAFVCIQRVIISIFILHEFQIKRELLLNARTWRRGQNFRIPIGACVNRICFFIFKFFCFIPSTTTHPIYM